MTPSQYVNHRSCGNCEDKNLPPDFIIIGAQKAGTTALYYYLSKHPQVSSTLQKELHFFNCDNRFQKGNEFYRNFFPITNAGHLTFDASPGYLHNRFAASRIHDYNNNVKLIALVRNPIDRAYSAWNMYRQRYYSDRNWFYSEWLGFCSCNDLCFKKRNDQNIFCFSDYVAEEISAIEDDVCLEAPVVSHGFYAEQLERYLKLFSKLQIHVVNHYEFREHTRETIFDIECFLGIDHHDYDSKVLLPVFEGNYTEAMDDVTRSLLDAYYGPHNEKLLKILGVDFGW